MNLFLNCLVVLASNSIILFIYQEQCFLIKKYNTLISFLKIKDDSQYVFKQLNSNDSGISPNSFNFSNDNVKVIETKRLQDLSIERIQLNNKLRMLDFITTFEMYLEQNKVDKERFNQFKEFNDLKLSAQKSILESTKKVSSLSAA